MKKRNSGRQEKRVERGKNNNRSIEEEQQQINKIKSFLELSAPPKGTNPLVQDLKQNNTNNTVTNTKNSESVEGEPSAQQQELKKYYESLGSGWTSNRFSDLPISQRTKDGLISAKYKTMTSIQRASFPHSLCGRDVLGAAKTGSGKTLAFLIPVLELLWREGWTRLDGIGALILSPTRELALQIFEVLCAIGHKHDQISAGLVIGGGKSLKDEKERINKMNILVCTPGRLLQHMDQTAQFTCDNLKILVLDEADRILDMGFSREITAILDNLPKVRQTLLFSATQTTSVSQLARLSLKDPEYIAVHAQSLWCTPIKLNQSYVFCPLEQKLDMLWSFIRSHLRSKSLIFFSTIKEVRFVNEVFRKLRPGVPLLHLHGKMTQHKRQKIFWRFGETTSGVVLFATDLAARGLDFKGVDWVVQMDCPEDVDTYIHRAGRTARYNEGGSSLLVLVPEETEMVQLLKNKKIPIEEQEINRSKTHSIKGSLQELLLQDAELKTLAQKAVKCYLRSIYLMENKQVFNVEKLPHAAFAASFGLMGTPQIKFTETKKIDKQDLINQEKLDRLYQNIEEGDNVIPVKPRKENKTKVQKLLKKKNANVLSESTLKLIDNTDDGEDVFVRKTENQTHLMEFENLPSRKKNRGPSLDTLDMEVDNKINYYKQAEVELQQVDPIDRKVYQQRINEKHKKLKQQKAELEAARKPKRAPVSITSPVDSDDEFEGKEDYGDETENLNTSQNYQNSEDSDSNSDSEEQEQEQQEKEKEQDDYSGQINVKHQNEEEQDEQKNAKHTVVEPRHRDETNNKKPKQHLKRSTKRRRYK